MLNSVSRWVAAGAFALALGTSASAQEALTHKYDPFFENLLYQNQVYGLEMVGQRLAMATAFQPPVNPALVPQLERMERRDYARFHGTLKERNPQLETQLTAALHDVMVGIQGGKDVAQQAAKARQLLQQASEIIVDKNVRDTPPFKAAVLANLLMANDGVAEAFEDAIRENWGFPNGWASVRRVEVLWKELEPMATPAVREEARSILDLLKNSFYAQPAPKIPFPNEEAEDVEALAHQMVTLIETTVDATLYMGRDLPKLADYLAKVLAPGCDVYAKGNKLVGDEYVHSVLDQYRVNLAGVLDLVAPELRKEAQQQFPRLVEVEYDFYEGFENVPPDPRNLTDEQRCRELVNMFTEAKKALL